MQCATTPIILQCAKLLSKLDKLIEEVNLSIVARTNFNSADIVLAMALSLLFLHLQVCYAACKILTVVNLAQ